MVAQEDASDEIELEGGRVGVVGAGDSEEAGREGAADGSTSMNSEQGPTVVAEQARAIVTKPEDLFAAV